MKQTPLGIIPAGSANAYAKNICNESKEELSAENCAYIIAKGQTRMFDLMEIESASRTDKIYSFLTLAFGLIADIDLESEKIRCCGQARFTLYGIYLLLCQRNNFGSFSYTTEDKIDKDFKFPSLKEELNPKYFTSESKNFSYFYSSLVPYTVDYVRLAPRSLPDDGMCDTVVKLFFFIILNNILRVWIEQAEK